MTTPSSQRAFLADILARQAARRKIIGLDVKEEYEPSKHNVVNYIEAEETIRNDLCAWYGTSGEFGGNYIYGAGDDEICQE